MADKVNQWMDSAKQTLSSQWEMKMSKVVVITLQYKQTVPNDR